VQAKDSDSVTAALDEVTLTLRAQHDLPSSGTEDDFSVINQQDILNSVASTTQTLTLFLGAIAPASRIERRLPKDSSASAAGKLAIRLAACVGRAASLAQSAPFRATQSRSQLETGKPPTCS
jgi:hypothetical protein